MIYTDFNDDPYIYRTNQLVLDTQNIVNVITNIDYNIKTNCFQN